MLGGRAARNRPSGMKAVSMFSTFFHILVFSLEHNRINTQRVLVPHYYTEGAGTSLIHRGCWYLINTQRVLVPHYYTEGAGTSLLHRGCWYLIITQRVLVPHYYTEGAGTSLIHRGCWYLIIESSHYFTKEKQKSASGHNFRFKF